jgi:hypothetical protein
MSKNQTKDQKRISAYIMVCSLIVISILVVAFIFTHDVPFLNPKKVQTEQVVKKIETETTSNSSIKNKKIKAGLNIQLDTINEKYKVLLSTVNGDEKTYNRVLEFLMYDQRQSLNFFVTLKESKTGENVEQTKIQVKVTSPITKITGISNADFAFVVDEANKKYHLVDLGSAKDLGNGKIEYNKKVQFFNNYGERWANRVINTEISFVADKDVPDGEVLTITKSLKLLDEIKDNN